MTTPHAADCKHTAIMPNGMCADCTSLIAEPAQDWKQPNYVVGARKRAHRAAFYDMRAKIMATR